MHRRLKTDVIIAILSGPIELQAPRRLKIDMATAILASQWVQSPGAYRRLQAPGRLEALRRLEIAVIRLAR